MGLHGSHQVLLVYLTSFQYSSRLGFGVKLTDLIVHNDWLCSFCYPTNLLKDCSLASISPSYYQNTKVGASELLPACSNVFNVCTCHIHKYETLS
jgi:hypothetical protein